MAKTAGLFVLLAMLVALAPSLVRAQPQHCERADIMLWGDGKHDDSAALNAWLRGEEAIWAQSGMPVGAAIIAHSFRLSAAIYVPGGTGRKLDDFRLLWPERGETVSGGTILAGTDPGKAPIVSGVAIVGGDAGEGKPFEAPDPAPADPEDQASCATS